jgi:glucosamine-6-phosphate deaminase
VIIVVFLNIFSNKTEMGKAAAEKVAELFEKILSKKSRIRFIAATGVSQFEFLEHLCTLPSIDWNRTAMFHLDEYIGITEAHPANFCKFLKERLVYKVNPREVYFIDGNDPNVNGELERLNSLISKEPIDIAFIGIGENGHLAFNDPPADFDTEDPYIIVDLDEKCRQQQVGEGWFKTIEEVPKKAISMSIKQILKAHYIICICPDKRKAEAVRNCLSENAEITRLHPASILKTHPNVFCYLDEESSSLL